MMEALGTVHMVQYGATLRVMVAIRPKVSFYQMAAPVRESVDSSGMSFIRYCMPVKEDEMNSHELEREGMPILARKLVGKRRL
jgi:hypothetical protein